MRINAVFLFNLDKKNADERWSTYKVEYGCTTPSVQQEDVCVHNWQLLQSAWIPAYDHHHYIPETIKARGQFLMEGRQGIASEPYQQVFIECRSSYSWVRRVYTLAAPVNGAAPANSQVASVYIFSDEFGVEEGTPPPTLMPCSYTNQSNCGDTPQHRDPPGTWSATHLGLQTFVMEISEVRCARTGNFPEEGSGNTRGNINLGEYARVWVRTVAEDVDDVDQLPTCVPKTDTWQLTRGCDTRENEGCWNGHYCANASTALAGQSPSTWGECAALCNMDERCSAFAYRHTGASWCWTCQYHKEIGSVENWGIYTKWLEPTRPPVFDLRSSSGLPIETLLPSEIAEGTFLYTDAKDVKFLDVVQYDDTCVFVRGANADKDIHPGAVQWILRTEMPITVYVDFWGGDAHAAAGFQRPGEWAWSNGWTLSTRKPASNNVYTPDMGPARVYEKFFESGSGGTMLGGNGGWNYSYIAFACTMEIDTTNKCAFDYSDCEGVMPGAKCEVKCAETDAYGGVPATAFCPPGNTNSSRPPVYEPPLCSPVCPLDSLPAGFIETAHQPGGFDCAAGYEGDPVALCTLVLVPPTPAPPKTFDDLNVHAHSGMPIEVIKQVPDQNGLVYTDREFTFYSLGGFTGQDFHYIMTPDDDRFSNTSAPMWTINSPVPVTVYLDFGGGQEHAEIFLAIDNGWVYDQREGTTTRFSYDDTEGPGIVYLKNFVEGSIDLIGNYDPIGGANNSNKSFHVYKVFLQEIPTTPVPTHPPPSDDACLAVPAYTFDGCLKRSKCKKVSHLTLDTCVYNTEACDIMNPGDTCDIGCTPPYVVSGAIGSGKCKDGNANPNQELSLTLPACVLDCPDPEPTPLGYSKTSSGWECAEGYTGTAKLSCYVEGYVTWTHRVCSTHSSLSGCCKLEPCAPLALPLGVCGYDLSMCQNVQPGGSCKILCSNGWENVGSEVIAKCPDDNADLEGSFEYELPNCTFLDLCSDPVPPPSMYRRTYVKASFDNPTGVGPWKCVYPGAGTVTETCIVGPSTCSLDLILQGCVSLLPCVLQPQEVWGVDDSDCRVVLPGGTCELKCSIGYEGNVSYGSCPSENFALSNLQWVLPNCSFVDCLLPDIPPEGYARDGGLSLSRHHQEAFPVENKHGEGVDMTTTIAPFLDGVPDAGFGWICAEGYAGVAVAECDKETAELTLSGCSILKPCVVTVSIQQCPLVNLTECANTSMVPGATCFVSCSLPYRSDNGDNTTAGTIAICPENNTDPFAEIVFTPPSCSLECGDLGLALEGYQLERMDGAEAWTCASGYVGAAVSTCVPDENCSEAVLSLSGCTYLIGCVDPEVDECVLDASDCERLLPGESCAVTCKTPLSGTPREGSCPFGNTDPTRPLEWSSGPMTCIRERCADTVPVGYMKTRRGWVCAPGFAAPTRVVTDTCGSVTGCELRRSGCMPELSLSGCEPLATCAMPAMDVCMHTIKRCEGIFAGESCTINCSMPYQGLGLDITCPADNTDPAKLAQGPLPQCELTCPDLLQSEIPEGYNWTEGGWACTQAFVGTPKATCVLDSSTYHTLGNCTSKYVLSECNRRLPCTAPYLEEDECRFYQDGCDDLPAGEACELGCTAPYVGVVEQATCPWTNVVGAGLVYRWPECELKCRDPQKPPLGYRKVNGTWTCADGYIGDAVITCIIDDVCIASAVFTGCSLLVPCAPKAVDDPCMYDTYECDSALPGEDCRIWCRAPFGGAPVTLLCPGDNADIMGEPVGNLPKCFCKEPKPWPVGYIKAPEEGWICDSGYSGVVEHRCSLPGGYCLSALQMVGCTPAVPCGAAPFRDLDPRPGYIEGIVRFGGAEVLGDINESLVLSYSVFFADSCGERVGGVFADVASVPRGLAPILSECCATSTYEVDFNAAIQVPNGATHIAVRAAGKGGEANIGVTIHIKDYVTEDGTASLKGKSTGAACRQARPIFLLSAVGIAAVASPLRHILA